MPLDPEILKIRQWAATGDRTDPDDASLDPPLAETVGWPASFSAADGDTPRRAVVNEIFYRLTTAITELLQRGLYEWDAGVDYLQHAIVQAGGSTWRATIATGPTAGNATDPTSSGQTVWARASSALGTATIPDAPDRPTVVASNGQLEWRWNCPRDNGAAVTSFIFQWRLAGGDFDASRQTTIAPSTAFFRQTGIANGQTYEVRVAAVNIEGQGPWSPIESGAAVAAVPAAITGLIALGLDGRVELDWATPSDGGVAITSYQVQWRSGSQAFGSARQATATGSPHFVTGLTNGTETFFRVRAINSVGSGPWSNIATAIPAASEVEFDRTFGTNGSGDFVWPWSTTRGLAIITAGAGGGGGSGGRGGRTALNGSGGSSGGAGGSGGTSGVGVLGEAGGPGENGSASGTTSGFPDAAPGGGGGGGGGESGANTQISYLANTIIARGGAGGHGGQGGQGHLIGSSARNGRGGVPGAGGQGFDSNGGGGSGGGTLTHVDTRDAFPAPGYDGHRGEVVYHSITISLGDVISITVGAGGAGGTGGRGGQSIGPTTVSHGLDGGTGPAGSVRIIPLY